MMEESCPSEEMLADYLEGRLSDDDGAEMEAHLSECKICLEGFMVAERLVRGGDSFELDSVPSKVTHAAVRLVNSWPSISSGSLRERFKRSIKGLHSRLSAPFSPTPWGEWGLAPIRGSRRGVSQDVLYLRKTFKDIDAEIEIEKAGEKKALIRVKLPRNVRKKSVRVTLKKGDREMASYLLDGAYVLFEDIPFGHYSISLAEDGVSFGTYLFEIKESRHGKR